MEGLFKLRLADPQFLLLFLILVPLWWGARRSGGKIIYSHIKLLSSDFIPTQFNPQRILSWVRLLALSLIILALCRPQAGKKFTESSSEGVDIMLAIDTSGSMHAMDFKLDGEPVDRLEVVKKVVKEFIKRRPHDRMGFVVFGDDAFTQCPLTSDHGILIGFLDHMEIGMAGNATAIGQAIGMGVKRMKDIKAKSRVLILLSDGENTAGRIPPMKAAQLAKNYKIKIYSIGVGTRGKAPFLQNTIFGKRYVYQQVEVDEEGLKKIALETGGRYYRATDTQELEKIYDEIDRLEKTKIDIKQYTEYHELFVYFLTVALLLLLGELIAGQTFWRKLP